jgi:hypothetical protein
MTTFTLRGYSDSRAEVTLTWEDGQFCGSDPEMVAMILRLAAAHKGVLFILPGGMRSMHRHLENPWAAYQLMGMAFRGHPASSRGHCRPAPTGRLVPSASWRRRHSMPADPRYPRVVFSPSSSDSDDDLEHEDWPKRSSDLPSDKAEFLAFLRTSCTLTKTSVRAGVAEYKRFPVYPWHKDHMPLDEWLRELRDDEA